MRIFPIGWHCFKKFYSELPSFYAPINGATGYDLFQVVNSDLGVVCSLVVSSEISEFESSYKSGCMEAPCQDAAMVFGAMMRCTEPDGKRVVVPSPASEGTFTWFSSYGDDLVNGVRGEGDQMLLSFTEPDSDSVEVQFIEPVEIHTGNIWWEGTWGFADHWGIYTRMPASTTTENTGGTGNCNKVALGGGANVIVPAAGDGDWDIDLETDAVPIPCDLASPGYWAIQDRWAEVITVATGDEKWTWNLFDFEIKMWFCKRVACGQTSGEFRLEGGTYKAEWLSKRWKLGFEATRATSGAGKIGGNFTIYRPGAT